jgi:hypothetical protein
MIQKSTKKRFGPNTLAVVKTTEQTVKDDIIEYISDLDNYTTQEIKENIKANRWWLETLLTIGTENEIKEYISETSIPYFKDQAIESLENSLKVRLDNICNVLEYQILEHDYQLDNTLRLFNEEQAIAIGSYENYLIIASEKDCHVIDTTKTELDKIHRLFTNGKVNIFYKAEETLPMIKKQKILMTNNIFDVTSAYKLLWGESITGEEIDKKVEEKLGNYSDKEKSIKKTQYLLKVRLELRQQIIDKKLIKEAKELFEKIAAPFTIDPSSLTLIKQLDKEVRCEQMPRLKYNEKKEIYEYKGKLTDKFISFKDEYEIVHVEKPIPVLSS